MIHLILVCIFAVNHQLFVKGSYNEPLSQFWEYERNIFGKGTLNNLAGIWTADWIEINQINAGIGPIVDSNLKRVLTIKNSGTAIESVIMEETPHFNGPYSTEQLWFVEGHNLIPQCKMHIVRDLILY